MLKQVIVVRIDLKMSCGKISAQVAHASLESYLRSDPRIREMWRNTGAKKVVLRAESLEELVMLRKAAEERGMNVVTIIDAGLTEVEPGTVTCIGVGPDDENKIDNVFGKLKLL
ncbi:MAG: peptidyl-tRNA hydrolase Pth2 [Candidatus Micrarchaeota archaeon]|nr:peptidyl-tRNA hydrolase Pth2 [Candidatus Micrarchaeota archaeon]MCX8154746.1 peptidyl-tRNA hydrolase Pth2 [Candidatus Micrarchaeota archaeon]